MEISRLRKSWKPCHPSWGSYCPLALIGMYPTIASSSWHCLTGFPTVVPLYVTVTICNTTWCGMVWMTCYNMLWWAWGAFLAVKPLNAYDVHAVNIGAHFPLARSKYISDSLLAFSLWHILALLDRSSQGSWVHRPISHGRALLSCDIAIYACILRVIGRFPCLASIQLLSIIC